MTKEDELVKKCLKNNAKALREFYERYASKMYGICIRFARVNAEADDILQEGFIRVFANLKSFRFEGSLEGWVKRIIVNTAINYLKKYTLRYEEVDLNNLGDTEIVEDETLARLSKDDLLKLVQELPEGKRVIFNLFAYEGYSHKEIANMLAITESTSKAQFFKAKKILQEKLEKMRVFSYERIH